MDAQRLIGEAIALAAATHPHPNPRVGALVLDASGRVVGRGAHSRRGEPHAEVLALGEAGERAAGGTLVVTLEPCDHEGTTPPCTEVVIGAGIDTVVVGATDPDPRVSGRGVARLEGVGIDVIGDVDPGAVEAADPGYFHHRRTGRPLLTVKWAATLDGQSAAADGSSQWITSEEAREDSHRLRAAADAVVVGAGTVLADDPALTVRLPGYSGRQPVPIVVAGRRPLPETARVWRRETIVYAPGPLSVPAEVVEVPGRDGMVDLEAVVDDLGRREVADVLVEGGPTLVGAVLRAGLAQRGVAYFGAMLGAGVGRPAVAGEFAALENARKIEIVDAAAVGPDVRIEFVVGGS